ncbi:MAG: hypothetical protein ACSHYF_05155 [Verrucomicrobiaceae bacterium]
MGFVDVLVAIWHVAVSFPLAVGIFCLFWYRDRRVVSSWLIVLLLAVSVASLVILFELPYSLTMYSSNILLLVGGVVTSVVGLGLWIRRFLSGSLLWLMPSIAIAELAVLAAVDYRFRIILQDPGGEAVDLGDGEMAIGYAGSSWGASFINIREGTLLGKGEYYFGLLLWLQHKDEWTFCGRFSDSSGNLHGDLEWKPAKWSEWPQHVIMHQKVER